MKMEQNSFLRKSINLQTGFPSMSYSFAKAWSSKLAVLALNITTCTRFLWLRSAIGLNPQPLTCSSCIDAGSPAGARMSSAHAGCQPMRSQRCIFLFGILLVVLGSYSVWSLKALLDRLLIWILWWLSQERLLLLSLRC